MTFVCYSCKHNEPGGKACTLFPTKATKDEARAVCKGHYYSPTFWKMPAS